MIDERGRDGGGPPTGAVPPDFCRAPSRHDHFPRDDEALRRHINAREAALDAALREEDSGSDSIIARMRELAHADPDTIFGELSDFLSDRRWIQARLAKLAAFAAAEPFAKPPVRIFSGGAMGGLILAEVAPIILSLIIRPFNVAQPPDGSVIFTPGQGLTIMVKSGGARMQRYRTRLSDADLAGGFRAATAAPCELIEDAELADGAVIRVDQQQESFNLSGGNGDQVMIQLFVQQPSKVPMREYDPATGKLIRTATANRANSFRQMGLAVLRTFGHRDAAPLFAEALGDPDFAMRWQVMREMIALDVYAALPHLAAMAASDPHPEVRAAAAQTLAIVRERLSLTASVKEAESCPM